MNQRSYLGTSLIDIAKASVETFMKVICMSIVWDYLAKMRFAQVLIIFIVSL